MNPMDNSMNGGTNLFSILLNIVFGFIAGLMILFSPQAVIAYGTKLAGDFMKLSGMGQQMGSFGFANYASYIVIAPIGGLIIKQLSSVRSLKSFAFFAVAVGVGFGIAFFGQGYFKSLLTP